MTSSLLTNLRDDVIGVGAASSLCHHWFRWRACVLTEGRRFAFESRLMKFVDGWGGAASWNLVINPCGCGGRKEEDSQHSSLFYLRLSVFAASRACALGKHRTMDTGGSGLRTNDWRNHIAGSGVYESPRGRTVHITLIRFSYGTRISVDIKFSRLRRRVYR